MKLEEYLEGLNQCPDEELQKEFGVYDNYPIIYQADYLTMIGLLTAVAWTPRNWGDFRESLERRDNTIAKAGRPSKHDTTVELNFRKLPIYAQVSNKIYFSMGSPSIFDNHNVRRLQEEEFYSGTIILHPGEHPDCKIPQRELLAKQLRDIANTITFVSEIIIRGEIPSCMPKIGLNYIDSDSASSRIVYHNTPLLKES